MCKPAPLLEWQVANDEVEWARLSASARLDVAPGVVLAAHEHRAVRRFIWRVVTMLLLSASIGGWVWHTTQAGFPETTAEVRAAAQSEVAAVKPGGDPLAVSPSSNPPALDRWRQSAQRYSSLHAAVQTGDPASRRQIRLDMVEFHGHQAVVTIVTTAKNATPAYRQTRFYRRVDEGWQPTAPDAALWGLPRSLETQSFVFHFRQNDAPAVIAVAPQLEALYTTLRQNFGLSLTPSAEKLVIEVSVTKTPGYAAPWFGAAGHTIVPSPALYRAPAGLTDADLLAQSIALPLLTHILAQASEHHAIGQSRQPLLNSLYLWQVWDLDLPLAFWQEEVVKWIYVDLPAIRPGQPIVLPARYAALCAEHKVWMPSPAQLNIPLLCADIDLESYYFSLWGSREPLTRLDQLAITVHPDEYLILSNDGQSLHHPGHTVALATLIEYAVATYERDRLPTLVAGLGRYDSWDTLLPAVYGVSPTEFEAGWQAYLVAHYGAVAAD